ncbi:MAG: beta-mannosidase [Chthonomonadetes bacterium]|nr:beta-mannosidase [Chthonomonadetes bacterium]
MLWLLVASLAQPSLRVGVIADELVDYSTWAKPYAAEWSGEKVTQILRRLGVDAQIVTRDQLTTSGLRTFDAVLIATDHTYPELGTWGGPVANALIEYVRSGGIYVMPIGVPHYIAKDLETGKLDTNHWEDFFGLRASVVHGATSLKLTRLGAELGLPEPRDVGVPPIRALQFEHGAVLVWSSDYVPCMVAIPYGKGWLLHWGGGESMDVSVRDYWLRAATAVVRAARDGRLKAMTLVEQMRLEGLEGKSLDDIDRETFAPAPSPLSGKPVQVKLAPGAERVTESSRKVLSLDGTWQMLGLPKGTGDSRALLRGEGWHDAVQASVPCSVQTALFEAGRIPDPTVGFNDVIARREVAEKEWWFRKEFEWRPGLPTRLVFEGVDYSATFYLNGVRLGEHEGPFGGPEFDITGIVREHNTLVVRVDPIPPDWKLVFKTNCVYGWHYVNCPPIGIWQSVRVEEVPAAEIEDVFLAGVDAAKGIVDFHATITSRQKYPQGVLRLDIYPANFEDEGYHLHLPVELPNGGTTVHLRFQIPHARPWWPNGLGEPNLYWCHTRFIVSGKVLDARRTRFGVRTVQMAPLPDGAKPHLYNWTFVINGRPTFVKGCNWATIDAFLRLDEHRYRRFLLLAKDAHIQIMRAWGGGLVETDTFYDLCDQLGIMVWQEFPLTWQNFDAIRLAVADEIAVRSIKRLRNHPSLVLWCGGNEHSGAGWLVELLGRRCYELDGTRPYHRTDPYGGSIHNYDVYWGLQPLERNLNLVAPFIGEFGLASPCAVESTLKYLPESEHHIWPPADDSAFIHHTPTFTPQNMVHLNRYAQEFNRCNDLPGFIRGSQMAQATGLRVVLEKMRTRWPDSTGVIYYKLTDVYPGVSWATVDWYGVPKIAHYFVQRAFAPLQVVALFDSFQVDAGKPLKLQVYLLDDREEWRDMAQVRVRLFDAHLQEVAPQVLDVRGGTSRVRALGEVSLEVPASNAVPLLVLVDLTRRDELITRNFYWFNFRPQPGCLFNLPRTTLSVSREGSDILVENTGKLPAVGVHFHAPTCSDSLRASEGYFWLQPGERRRIHISFTPNVDGKIATERRLEVGAWNADYIAIDMGG